MRGDTGYTGPEGGGPQDGQRRRHAGHPAAAGAASEGFDTGGHVSASQETVDPRSPLGPSESCIHNFVGEDRACDDCGLAFPEPTVRDLSMWAQGDDRGRRS